MDKINKDNLIHYFSKIKNHREITVEDDPNGVVIVYYGSYSMLRLLPGDEYRHLGLDGKFLRVVN